MSKFKKIINCIQFPWLKNLYNKYKNPLKDVKQEQKPLSKISRFDLLIVLGIIKPYKKEPIKDTIKILFK